MKPGSVYKHKDGGLYKLLDVEKIEKTIMLSSNVSKTWSNWCKFNCTLVWYSPVDDTSNIYVRTLNHFSKSFVPIIQRDSTGMPICIHGMPFDSECPDCSTFYEKVKDFK